MATPPNHKREDAPTERSDSSLNWGWIGCLGLAAILLLNPISLMVLGMVVGSSQIERVFERTPEASELICHEVAPVVVARIEAGLTNPERRLHDVRAVHADRDGWLGFIAADQWYIAADVHPHGIAVWRLSTRGDPRTGEGAPESAIATVASGVARQNVDADAAFATGNGLAYDVSNFPLGSPMDRPDLKAAAEACVSPRPPVAPTPPEPSELPELVCSPVAPEVVARIEAALTVPGTRLRGVRAVRPAPYVQLWVVAADLEGVGRYEGDDDIGVWTVRWDDAAPPGTPEAPTSVVAVNDLAAQAGPFPRFAAERRLVVAAVDCANEALGRS